LTILKFNEIKNLKILIFDGIKDLQF
jgi:hypothetical protein